MRSAKMIAIYRLLLSLLAFSALITQFVTRAQVKPFNPVNFFSFFTIESNILVAVILLFSSFGTALFGRSEQFGVLRGAATVYILSTGLYLFFVIKGIRRVTSNSDTMGKYCTSLHHAISDDFRLGYKSTYEDHYMETGCELACFPAFICCL